VVRGFGKEPLVVLTNVEADGRRVHPLCVCELHLARWKCEDTYRFVKQGYNLEHVPVRSYMSLRNIYVLVHAALYSVSVVVGAGARLRLIPQRVCQKAKRFFEIANSFHLCGSGRDTLSPVRLTQSPAVIPRAALHSPPEESMCCRSAAERRGTPRVGLQPPSASAPWRSGRRREPRGSAWPQARASPAGGLYAPRYPSRRRKPALKARSPRGAVVDVPVVHIGVRCLGTATAPQRRAAVAVPWDCAATRLP
jgi:hypothetical protein